MQKYLIILFILIAVLSCNSSNRGGSQQNSELYKIYREDALMAEIQYSADKYLLIQPNYERVNVLDGGNNNYQISYEVLSIQSIILGEVDIDICYVSLTQKGTLIIVVPNSSWRIEKSTIENNFKMSESTSQEEDI